MIPATNAASRVGVARRSHAITLVQMPQHVARVALLVRDYDEAIAWFTTVLGFHLVEDTPMTAEKRWVVVAPSGAGDMSLLLARAANPDQRAMVGRQGGGRVFLFLHTDTFEQDYAGMRERGVHFVEEPREETYGRVVVFEDLYGNRWDLVQRHAAPRPVSQDISAQARVAAPAARPRFDDRRYVPLFHPSQFDLGEDEAEPRPSP